MQVALLIFLLFGLPLIVIPIGYSAFEIPKVLLAQFGIVAMLLYQIFSSGRIKLADFPKSFRWWAIIFTLLSLVHMLLFNTPTLIFGNAFRLQGVLLQVLLIIFAWLTRHNLIKRMPNWPAVISALLLSISVFVFGGNDVGRAIGTLGEPNALAATAVFIWPFIFLDTHTGKLIPKWQKIFSLTFILFILLFTGSRSGLLAFIIQVFLMVATCTWKLPLKKSVIISGIILLVCLLLPFLEKSVLFENRAEIWQTAYLAGWQSPLIGHGFGNVESALKSTAFLLSNNLRFQYVDSSHNIFLDWWVQGGIVGIGLFLFLLILSFKALIRNNRILEVTLFLGLLTALTFNPASVVSLIAFWWLLGQGIGKYRSTFSL